MSQKLRKQSLILVLILCTTLLLTAVAVYTPVEAAEEEYFFELHLIVAMGRYMGEECAPVYVDQLAKIGIKVIPEYMEWGAAITRLVSPGYNTFEDGGTDLFLIQEDLHFDPDQIAWWGARNLLPEGFNVAGFSDGRHDKIAGLSLAELDPEKRLPYNMEMQRIWYEAMPSVPLWFPTSFYVVNPHLKGFAPVHVELRQNEWYWESGYEKDTIIMATPGAPTGLLGGINTGYAGGFFCEPFTSKLLRIKDMRPEYATGIDENPYYEGDLAESVDVSEDGLVITYTLHDNIKWQDGVPLTSEDVKWTFDKAMEEGSTHGSAGRFRDSIDYIETPDSSTVTIHMKKADNLALGNWHENGAILPKHILEDIPMSEWKTHWLNTGAGGQMPIGPGPYQLVEIRTGEYYKYEAFEDYFEGPAKVKTLIMEVIPDVATALAAFKAGEVDVLDQTYSLQAEHEDLVEDPDANVVDFPSAYLGLILTNTQHPILQNENVRHAIFHAIDRETMCDTIWRGLATPATGVIWHEVFDPELEAEIVGYDIDVAKEYMEKAGYKFEWLEPAEPIEPTNGEPTDEEPYDWIPGLSVGIVIGAIIAGISVYYYTGRKA